MPSPLARRLAALLVVVPFPALGLAGCGPDQPKLADAPLVPVAIPKSVEELPKDQRPKAGSSAGMNYDPSGVNPRPPVAPSK